jgi:hypothetical protein
MASEEEREGEGRVRGEVGREESPERRNRWGGEGKGVGGDVRMEISIAY